MNVKNIKMVVSDVDGTLTDGGLYLDEAGREFRKFNIKDGMGIKLLMEKGIKVGLMSSSHIEGIVLGRASMLNVDKCYVGKESKLEVLGTWLSELGLQHSQVAYVGDDVNDKEVMQRVGFSVCPADADQEIINIVDHVLTKKGGDGAFREFANLLIQLRP